MMSIKYPKIKCHITEQEQKQAPPPPEAPKVEEVLQIVENDAKVEETAIQASEETGQAVEVKYVPVEVEEEEPEEQQIFQVVEEMPEFPGGMAECLKFLGKNIKYPTISQENGVQGKVIVQFVVNKDGSIVDPVVVPACQTQIIYYHTFQKLQVLILFFSIFAIFNHSKIGRASCRERV